MSLNTTQEFQRLEEDRARKAHWRRWGPYISDRQWGTVREDYSADGTAWEYLPHDHARSRAYRWGEDGLFGLSDNHQQLCFALSLWNGKDAILKERFFGLTGNQGNHGEDVKEYYFYVDNTPTHSYMKALYKYPQAEFPYQRLEEENRRRTRLDPEFELMDTGIFADNRYFDVTMEYAKASTDDVGIRITAVNRGPDAAPLTLLPTLWFRNTWSWKPNAPKPVIHEDAQSLVAEHSDLGTYVLAFEPTSDILFTENETNTGRVFGIPNATPYVKDAFHRYVVNGERAAVNPLRRGTKAAVSYTKTLAPGETWTVHLRLSAKERADVKTVPTLMNRKIAEADAFYAAIVPPSLGADAKNVQRQAFAGMLWSKQYYNYVVKEWLDGDPGCPPPPEGRKDGRNTSWEHLYSEDVLSMPDNWEYPWFASWDLAFHCIPLAMIDPEFAKKQLILLTREWYMHPNGQIPAYEWAFGDANPPVHAWAAWRVYKIEKKMRGQGDLLFLERVFQKLLMNFTWWVNRKDAGGMNIFQGGFLGLDNIGVFDRNLPIPGGGLLEQSDGTSWMAMYSLNLMTIAVELAHHNPSYEDIASKFFEHFLYISEAMRGKSGMKEESLWDDEDGFFYDSLHFPDGRHIRMKLRTMVGLIPLFAVETLEIASLFKLPNLARRINWFIENRPDLASEVTCNGKAGACERRLLSIATPDMLKRILEKLFSEAEFLGPHGVRSVSRYHADHPFLYAVDGETHRVDYEPAESSTGLFGGNSNWRGPVWWPVNFLLIESLQKFHHYLGNDFKIECPTGSGNMLTLWQAAMEISHRLNGTFLKQGPAGRRPVFGGNETFQTDPHWKDYPLFYEYFHGDNGAGIGASHQTGWTGLVAKLLQQCGEHCHHG
jgi:hypothetical protein